MLDTEAEVQNFQKLAPSKDHLRGEFGTDDCRQLAAVIAEQAVVGTGYRHHADLAEQASPAEVVGRRRIGTAERAQRCARPGIRTPDGRGGHTDDVVTGHDRKYANGVMKSVGEISQYRGPLVTTEHSPGRPDC